MRLRRIAPPALLFLATSTGLAQSRFRAPEVISVTDAYTPYSVFDGFFVLEVSLDETGAVKGTAFLRNPGALGPAAVTTVRGWKFRPAEEDGNSIPSQMTVAFVYRPQLGGPALAMPPKDFKPVLPSPGGSDNEAIGYVPPGIVSFAYPAYPVNSVAWGSVIIQATVSAAGKAERPQVLLGKAPFTALALAALEKWRFQAGTFRGRPVRARIAIAFVFQTPVS